MERDFEEKKQYPDQDSVSDNQISQQFNQVLNLSNGSESAEILEKQQHDDDENEEEDEEEFSFMAGEVTSPVAAEDAFMNGQIKPVYPLFDMGLLLSSEDLPMKPPVSNVFVEMNERDCDRVTSSKLGNDDVPGPGCDWWNRKAVEVETEAPPPPEGCKKSNSTGFSKIWRFKDLMGRSNSDGRDAFVFLNNNNSQSPPRAAEHNTAVAAEKPTGKLKKVSKAKTAPLSAHEVYLKSKAKEERRRSYLPYKPELMGFFTNVHGGLSKNIHPY